jgi:hypothetical protein
MLRFFGALVLSAALLLGAGVGTASASTLSMKAALKKTGQIARKAAVDTDGVAWFAGACKRATRRKVSCWGGVAYADDSGCIQKVVVTRGRRITGKRTGRVYCGEVPGNTSSGTGGGGGGGSPAICAIRQSVCI